ncbi:helix-turn-helix domain-containing protein [Robiginitalea biformata]|uniref:HTH cro/C1-type domain-containing protein n=1 Tax=Robiginitalea biformata (strain ATCC BAA-864 / DSM 15991 / KCTC 12146 / HTCC2501) TaxID=313596 RepID=A4CKL0_ROBBH|nr:helix-turn-helix transcriptional regulator [Robiginitalea biformata]EAR15409.1 hypothetical protein RB2501_13814 [Robiginitalea biformata HTCC2501]
MPISNNLPDNLRFLLTHHQISQGDLGNMIGTRAKNVSNWVNGVSNPPIEMLMAIANEFNVTLDQLIIGDVSSPVPGYVDFVADNRKNRYPTVPKSEESEIDKDHLIQLLQNQIKAMEGDLSGKLKGVLEQFYEENFSGHMSKIDDLYEMMGLPGIMENLQKNMDEINRARQSKKGR